MRRLKPVDGGSQKHAIKTIYYLIDHFLVLLAVSRIYLEIKFESVTSTDKE